MSWKPEVRVVNDPKYYSNSLRFASEREAAESARDLSWRWTAVESWRATECDDPVTHYYLNGKAEFLHPIEDDEPAPPKVSLWPAGNEDSD